ncbi:hypothetical protein BGZ83_011965 [Gryganskiella cystojenkinii]|nr:hypothetical protein BGZ83_011965 [Gryganskiella cystojenkinii]
MVSQPRRLLVLLKGRSAWKALAETDYFVLQHHPRQLVNAYRIITRGFPHYRVAEGNSETLLQVELEYLSQMARVSIEGKITSKKIANWLKSTFSHNNILAISPPEVGLIQQANIPDLLHHDDQLELHQDQDGYISDSSYISSGEMTDRYSSGKKTKRPLRRAISLEDITTATAIHRQLQSSGLLLDSPTPNQQPEQDQRTSSSSLSSSSPIIPRRAVVPSSLLSRHPIDRPSSSASAPNRSTTVMLTPDYELTFVPLKDRPASALALNIDHESFRDHADQHSLPTPDVSPEELSDDSSDDLEETENNNNNNNNKKSIRSLEGLRSTSQARRSTFPGAETSTLSGGVGGDDTRTIGGISILGDANTGTFNWITDSPYLESLVSWVEGLEPSSQQQLNKSQEKDKPNPWLDIPFQFIALLTYPEPDPKTGKMSLAMVRETAFVRQRRKILLMLTCYTLVVRYCSFDFFLVVLFASNCGMLFLMKNSGRMNVNMAKRAVRQRVGWAKQWAGSIFRKGGSNNNNISGGNHASSSSPKNNSSSALGSPASQHHQNSSLHSVFKAESIMTSTNVGDNSGAMSSETSPQIKRRGLFGKRVTIGNNNNNNNGSQHLQNNSASSIPMTINSNHGEAASVVTATTTKRRFFRRGNNNNSGSSSTLPVMAASAPVPIPARKSNSSSTASLAAANSTSASTRLTTAMNTQLSTSPLAQPQSLPQLQFSPLRPFSPPSGQSDADMDSADNGRPRTRSGKADGTPPLPAQALFSSSTPIRSSSPSPLQQQHYPQQQQQTLQARKNPEELKVGPVIVSPVPVPISSSPMMFSGLSQLLGRSSPSPTSARAASPSPLEYNVAMERKGSQQYGSSSMSSIATAKSPLLGDDHEHNNSAVSVGEGRRGSVDKLFSYSRFSSSSSAQDGGTSSSPEINSIATFRGKIAETGGGTERSGVEAEGAVTLDAVTSAAANAMDGI